MATVVRAYVFDAALIAQFQPGGQANDYGKLIQRQVYALAAATAPRGPGRVGHTKPADWRGPGTLQRSHRNRGMLWEGRLRIRGSIEVTASYAEWVHEGHGPVVKFSPKGKAGLRIPRTSWIRYRALLASDNENGMYVFRSRVGGYRGNPWLDNAGTAVARSA